MSAKGPIVIIEDDLDDQLLLGEIFNDIKVDNAILYFSDAKEALLYLQTTTDRPFIIICDVNLPKVNGLELKRIIDSDKQLRKKSIPFIFYSTAVSQQAIDEAYINLNIQGFFQKGHNYAEIKELIRCMVDYWLHCWHPNT
jgi:CheY-like chemotaxis protein